MTKSKGIRSVSGRLLSHVSTSIRWANGRWQTEAPAQLLAPVTVRRIGQVWLARCEGCGRQRGGRLLSQAIRIPAHQPCTRGEVAWAWSSYSDGGGQYRRRWDLEISDQFADE
jgi:hypothetical protein